MSEIVNRLYADYLKAYQMRVAAENQANSLRIISSDIYTEEERFIYELIQNAVDAYADTANQSLLIEIRVKENYLIFMHNGSMFSDRDVEGICGIANGGKMADAKKIGYKGIGFKSVFVHSDDVTISSGSHCFRFAADEWDSYGYKMPWQIIPIECNEPVSVDNRSEFNVATYIRLKRPQEITRTIVSLMGNSQFLLFLKCAEAEIRYVNDGTVLTLSKKTDGEIIELFSNGVSDSRWLTRTIPIERALIPEATRKIIANDEKTPNKLKESDYFDLSFAIKVEDGKIVRVEEHEAVLYTYLPTSMQSGFPFLVNANFITDAGRQQIHKDCEWNKFLYSVIPGEFLNWMSEISRDYPDYYKVLPSFKRGDSALDKIFNENMKASIAGIAFIPSLKGGNLLSVSASIVDRTGINGIFDNNAFIEYVNRQFSKDFSENSFIANQGVSVLMEYGVFVFDNSKLKDLFNDDRITADTDVEFSLKLIRYLDNHANEFRSIDQKNDFMENLSRTRIILSGNKTMEVPSSLFLPSACKVGMTDDVPVVNENLYSRLSQGQRNFIRSLGVHEQTYSNYILNVLCRKGYVTKDNAIAVGRFIFNAFVDGHIGNDDLHKLGGIKFLSKAGDLRSVNTLFLSGKYNPRFCLDGAGENDEYLVSENYASSGDNLNDWNFFLKGIGVKDEIGMSVYRYSSGAMQSLFGESCSHVTDKINYDPNPYIHTWGVQLQYYPLILTSKNREVLKTIFSEILSAKYSSGDESCSLEFRWSVEEHMKLRGDFWQIPFLDKFSLRAFTLKNVQLFPSADGKLTAASELFVNSPVNVSIAGKYLPVIDVDCEIHSSWASVLNLKRDLALSDYLKILTAVASDPDADNRGRIDAIYAKIVEGYSMQAEYVREAISGWAATNKILSADGVYRSPADLAFITIPGFDGGAQIYLSEPDMRLIPLFEIMGVKIITSDLLESSIEGPVSENERLRMAFAEKACAISLVKAGIGCNDEQFRTAHEEICERLNEARFYHCAGISVHSANFQKQMLSYHEGNDFYYTGSFSFAKIDALLTPLCEFLSIPGNERTLLNVLLNNSMDLKEYLVSLGYNTEYLSGYSELPAVVSVDDAVLGGQIGGDINQTDQYEQSAEAKSLVCRRLEAEGFVFTEGLGQYSVISGVVRDGVEYPLVVKSCKNHERRLKINPSEWEHLFRPNSMLWLHFGGGQIFPINVAELFAYQDKLTLSFDTSNLIHDNRLKKIMDVMRYFNNVHFDVQGIIPDQNRGNSLHDYMFATNSDGDDLTAIDESILL